MQASKYMTLCLEAHLLKFAVHHTVILYATEDNRKLDQEKFHSTHANSHLPNGELGGYGYNANNIYIYFFIMLIEKIIWVHSAHHNIYRDIVLFSRS